MYAVEFQATIENGTVHIPKNYQNLYQNQEVQIFIMPISKKKIDSFDPKKFFGVAKVSKDEIDQYLRSSKNEWDKYLYEK